MWLFHLSEERKSMSETIQKTDLEFINECVKHIHPDTMNVLLADIRADVKLKEKLTKRRAGPLRTHLQEVLKLKELPAGISTGSPAFWIARGWIARGWIARGWTAEEAAEKTTARYANVNLDNTPYKRTAKRYEGMTEDQITFAINALRPNNVEYYLAQGMEVEAAEQARKVFQSKSGNSPKRDKKAVVPQE